MLISTSCKLLSMVILRVALLAKDFDSAFSTFLRFQYTLKYKKFNAAVNSYSVN